MTRRRLAVLISLAVLLVAPLPGLLPGPAGAAPSTEDLWSRVTGTPAASHRGNPAALKPEAFRAFRLDRAGMQSALRATPAEFSSAAASSPFSLSLPAPGGGFQEFAVQESPIMEPGLAALHPDIKTYNGRGVTDPTASIRFDLTPLGFHASVRGQQGAWYIDPYYRGGDQSLYVTYFGRNLRDQNGDFVERGLEELARAAEGAGPLEAQRSSGDQLRVYRLALVTDPSYANYIDPSGTNPGLITPAKVSLVNRVTQIYEDDTSIRMIMVTGTDQLNLNTAALATGANGPCGQAACYTTAQLNACSSGLLSRTRIVIGTIIGAHDYDVGHIGLGKAGGGIASLGVVGGNNKAQGCTGVPAPIGDFFAVDYVAHELGHQYSGNHTFNGTQHNCSGANRNPSTSVEPGSGSSIMAYAGICRQDDLQPHSDPYWSQRSFDEIQAYVTGAPTSINEVQNAALKGFNTDGDSFTLTFNATTSAPVTRGTTYNIVGITAALASIGVTATVSGFGGATTPDDTGFQVSFTGAQALMDVPMIQLTNQTGLTGFINDIAQGGPIDNQGWQVNATGNSAPVVTAPTAYTIPYRTPFALTGSATDADGDILTYLWEQNDIGTAGTALVDANKTNGPLFRQFGVALTQPPYDPTQYNSPGENHPTTDPTRVFPDMPQILINNTNAETANCPGPPIPPPPPAGGTNVPKPQIDCYSEFLPTSAYPGPMHFRLTARDGHPGGGGVNSADTLVNLAPGTGPFLVTSPNTPVSYQPNSTQTVTWNVAGTSAAPISAANVAITMSADGGQTFQYTLAASTPNDGSETVLMPNVGTTHARVRIQGVGNIFFDVSNENFTILPANPQCPGYEGDPRNQIVGTPGADVKTGTEGADIICGLGGNDVLYGKGGADVLVGEDGNDQLFGGAGADVILGGIGNDQMSPGAGDDPQVDGGAGSDGVNYSDATSGVTVDLVAGTATGGSGTDTLAGIENVGGSNFPDTLTGSSVSNQLDGRGGVDVIDGGGGSDVVTGGAGADDLDGQAGNDTADYYSSPNGATVDLTAGTASDDGSAAHTADTLAGFENARGSNGGADVLTGTSATNHLFGFGGDDDLFGLGGNDRLDGGAGTSDDLDGGLGNDTCLNGETNTSCEA